VLRAANVLRRFLFERVYSRSLAGGDVAKAEEALRLLYCHFLHHEDELPPELVCLPDGTERKVVDYIAGMTDQYALRLAEELSQ
jgi:dGTPase